MESFSFNPPINLVDEGKYVLAVMSFEAKKCFNKIEENNTFSNTTPGYWLPLGCVGTVRWLNKLSQLLSQNGIELHKEEVRESGNQ